MCSDAPLLTMYILPFDFMTDCMFDAFPLIGTVHVFTSSCYCGKKQRKPRARNAERMNDHPEEVFDATLRHSTTDALVRNHSQTCSAAVSNYSMCAMSHFWSWQHDFELGRREGQPHEASYNIVQRSAVPTWEHFVQEQCSDSRLTSSVWTRARSRKGDVAKSQT